MMRKEKRKNKASKSRDDSPKPGKLRPPPRLPDHISKGYAAIICAAAFTVYLLVTGIVWYMSLKPVTELVKPEAGTEESSEELILEEGGKKEKVTLTVPARERSREEILTLLQKAKKEIREGLKGENESLSHVTKGLYMPDSACQGLVSVSYSWDPYAYLDYDGSLTADLPEEGAALTMEIELSMEGESEIFTQKVSLYAESDETEENLTASLEEANKDSADENYHLPSSVGEKAVTWYPGMKNPAALFAFLVLFAGIVIPLREQENKKTKEQKEKKELMLEYPHMVSQTMLFMGAGMNIREVFMRLSKADKEGKRSPLAGACHSFCLDIAQGYGEAGALQRFGERCGVLAYRTFASMLVQNMKKGNAFLLPMLKDEAAKAFAERQRQARILGSEAGTKLLLPMMLMLLVVMILVLYPAMLSF